MKMGLWVSGMVLVFSLVVASATAPQDLPDEIVLQATNTNVDLKFVAMKLTTDKKSCKTTLQATLTNADNGKPLAGKRINFSQDTIGSGSVVTDTLGHANLVVPSLQGPHSSYAQFAGNSNYSPAQSLNVEYTCTLPPPPVILNLPLSLGTTVQCDPKGDLTDCTAFSFQIPQEDAAGGIGAPYHFELRPGYGFPPLGIVLAPAGFVSGKTKSPPKKYPFEVIAIDEAGNESKGAPTSVRVTPRPLPNLTLYQSPDWSSQIVVTTEKGACSLQPGPCSNSSPLLTTDKLYINFIVINDSDVPVAYPFSVRLRVDGVVKRTWSLSSIDAHEQIPVTGYPIGSLTAGTHAIKIKVDSTLAVKEVNETDDVFTKTITVKQAPPVSISVTSISCTTISNSPVAIVNGTACGPVDSHASSCGTPLYCGDLSYNCCSAWTGQYCTRKAGEPACTEWTDYEYTYPGMPQWRYCVSSPEGGVRCYVTLPECP